VGKESRAKERRGEERRGEKRRGAEREKKIKLDFVYMQYSIW